MNNGSDFDFIIIGFGAGGGTLAYRLAPSGKRILLIERGPFVRREKENWNSLEVNARGRYNTKELWRNGVAHQNGRIASATIRRRARWIATAKRTSSITSALSMQASS